MPMVISVFAMFFLFYDQPLMLHHVRVRSSLSQQPDHPFEYRWSYLLAFLDSCSPAGSISSCPACFAFQNVLNMIRKPNHHE